MRKVDEEEEDFLVLLRWDRVPLQLPPPVQTVPLPAAAALGPPSGGGGTENSASSVGLCGQGSEPEPGVCSRHWARVCRILQLVAGGGDCAG